MNTDDNSKETQIPPFDENAFEELLDFFKTLADAKRLKIVGLLAQQPLSVEQMAGMLELHPSTVSHHLARLRKAGLVSARSESYYNIYELDTNALENMAQRLLARDSLPEVAADIDTNAYDRKVLRTFTNPDGTLKALPNQRKKLEVILRYLLKEFEPGRRYTEKEVNEIIGRFYADISGLRRDMIDHKFMEREKDGAAYWLK